jgi:hypothetical protein
MSRAFSTLVSRRMERGDFVFSEGLACNKIEKEVFYSLIHKLGNKEKEGNECSLVIENLIRIDIKPLEPKTTSIIKT